MDVTSMVTIGVVLILGIGGAVAFYFYRKRNIVNLFNHVYDASRQVPKSKKNSFLLFMFKESITSSKKKSKKATSPAKLNNPKYLEIQMMQMAHILKDSSKVKDKSIKRALNLLTEYLKWEKAKYAKAKELSQEKAS